MSLINFKKIDKKLIIHYETESDWLEEVIKNEEKIVIYKTFFLDKTDLILKRETYIGFEYDFTFGFKEDGYYKINKKKINTNFNLYIEESLMPDRSWFVTSSLKSQKYRDTNNEERTTSIYGNILHVFNKFYKNDKLYIDGDTEETFHDDGFHLTQATYNRFVEIFPTATNVRYQTLSIFTNLLKNELDVIDYEEIYNKYKRKRVSVHSKPNIINDEILKLDKIKFIYAKEQLENSLINCENGEFIHEDDFSELIAQFFCLINPKYIKIKTKLNISDFTDARINCQADLCLIDCDGNIDLIEVKSPRAYKNVFRKRPYRSHFVPSGELCGAINQLEQYLKCLTKMTVKDIADKNPDLQRELDGIKLKNVNPKGYIIYGRDYVSFNGINEAQKKADFELIKNTYKDLVDIITFDDLIRRFERIINFL